MNTAESPYCMPLCRGLLTIRLQSAKDAAQNLTQEQAHAQMRRNGSIPSINPWYTGEKANGSLRLHPKVKQ